MWFSHWIFMIIMHSFHSFFPVRLFEPFQRLYNAVCVCSLYNFLSFSHSSVRFCIENDEEEEEHKKVSNITQFLRMIYLWGLIHVRVYFEAYNCIQNRPFIVTNTQWFQVICMLFYNC